MQTIPGLFATAVEHFTNRPALIEPTEYEESRKSEIRTLSYYVLQEQVHAFAGHLQEQNVAPGERLLIWSASRNRHAPGGATQKAQIAPGDKRPGAAFGSATLPVS